MYWTIDMQKYLLQEVKTRPCLWNPHDNSYTKQSTKKRAFEEIANIFTETFNLPERVSTEEVCRKFRNLKTYYFQQLQKLKAQEMVKWVLFENATFLSDFNAATCEAVLRAKTASPAETDDDLENLISHVRNYEHLFNPLHKEYRNLEARKEAWDEIGANFGVSGDECKETWNKLRNAYTNARLRRLSGETPKLLPNWKYEEQMSFLLPTLQQRSIQGNLKMEEDFDENGDTGNDSESVQIVDEDDCSREEQKESAISRPSTPPDVDATTSEEVGSKSFRSLPTLPPVIIPPPFRNRKRLLEEYSTRDNNRTKSERLTQTPDSRQLPDYTSDETEMFFLSLSKNVKKLSRAEQARVKMEVCKAVFQAELRDLQHDSQPTAKPSQLQTEPSPASPQSPVNSPDICPIVSLVTDHE